MPENDRKVFTEFADGIARERYALLRGLIEAKISTCSSYLPFDAAEGGGVTPDCMVTEMEDILYTDEMKGQSSLADVFPEYVSEAADKLQNAISNLPEPHVQTQIAEVITKTQKGGLVISHDLESGFLRISFGEISDKIQFEFSFKLGASDGWFLRVSDGVAQELKSFIGLNNQNQNNELDLLQGLIPTCTRLEPIIPITE